MVLTPGKGPLPPLRPSCVSVGGAGLLRSWAGSEVYCQCGHPQDPTGFTP